MRRIPICFSLLLTMALVTSTEAAPEPTPATAPAALDSLRARSLQGDAEAQKALGDAYAAGNGVEQSDKTAVDWYAKAADHGLASAESALAGMIFNGRAGPVDLKLAEQWLHKAAEQGYARRPV